MTCEEVAPGAPRHSTLAERPGVGYRCPAKLAEELDLLWPQVQEILKQERPQAPKGPAKITRYGKVFWCEVCSYDLFEPLGPEERYDGTLLPGQRAWKCCRCKTRWPGWEA